MKRLTRHALASIFLDLHEKHSHDTATHLFAQLITAQKRTHEIDLIVGEINREIFKRTRHLNIFVTSAKPLSNSLVESLQHMALTQFQAKTINLTQKIDSNVIGGFVLTSPDYELNASVRNKLQTLEALHV